MRNAVYLTLIIVCAGLIIFGLTRNQVPQSNQDSTQASLGQPAGLAPATSSVQSVSSSAAIGQNAAHFRPDTANQSGNAADSSAATAERNFIVTPDLLAKMYLVDKYKPGVCFGAPAAVPQTEISGLISANPPLTEYLQQKYGLNADLEIYRKLKQLQDVALVETASSKFNFAFRDGQCQDITYYEGIVAVSGSSVTATVTTQTN